MFRDKHHGHHDSGHPQRNRDICHSRRSGRRQGLGSDRKMSAPARRKGILIPHSKEGAACYAALRELRKGVRFLVAVRGPKFAQACAPRMVAVLDIFPRFMWAARSEVNAKHWLGLSQFAPLNKFVCSECVGLGAEPSEIEPFRSFWDRAHAIFPVIARHKIASRIANDRRSKFSN